MKFRALYAFIILFIFYSVSYSQTTYFIKYKANVSPKVINEMVSNQNFLPSQKLNQTLNKSYQINHFAQNLGKNDINLSRIVKVTFNNSVDAQKFVSDAKSNPDIEYIQKANIYKIESLPNDSLVSGQWGLKKIGAFDAWNITKGADTVLIGLIDTGIDYLHPDLKNKIYINKGEIGLDKNGNDKRTNGIDDDGNGFVDDFMGWDFTDRRGFPFDSSGGDYLTWDNNPMDENGHGTEICGIMAAETNNHTGIAGVAPNIKVLNLRAFDPNGYGEEDDVAAAILYAVKMGVKVINMSFGDTQFSYVLKDVIKYAYDRNVVLVGSSGNEGSDEPHYPSGYSEVICVGNSTDQDYVASSSNYGSTLDLVAPGTSILTTARHNSYAEVSGTSASSPFVSASSALLLSLGNFTNEEVKQILKSTSDDIDITGWDLRSGSGRLNLFKALSVVAPSIIKFDYPKQDLATTKDTLNISATILSAYFQNYSLYVGTGLNPNNWQTLIDNENYQFSSKSLYSLNIKNYADSVYTLRLVVNQTNGKALEERVNFYVQRNPPKTDLIFIGPTFYGNKSTILASVYTNQPAVVKLYFRKIGDTNFNFITLDGFATNIQTVKQLHYGFIPKDLIEQNTDYEVYLEATNLAGLKTIIKNNGNYFNLKTDEPINISYESEEQYTLPAGEIYQNPVSVVSSDSNQVFLRPIDNPKTTYLYRLQGNKFEKVDSLNEKIVRAIGDFNNNGKKDILTSFVRNGFLEEQQSQNSGNFTTTYSDTSGKFWPIGVYDLYGNGKHEVLAVNSDTSINISDINDNLTLGNSITLNNFTNSNSIPGNIITAPNAVITDMNGDGKKEIWMIDADGDLYSYNIDGVNNFSKGKEISTGFIGASDLITSGDFTGNGKDEMAILLHSVSSLDIAPYYRLLIFNFINDSLNVIYDHPFIDQADEFSSSFHKSENSLRFADVNNNGHDELLMFTFPYSYIFNYENGATSIISYKENINSSTIFIGDLNKDGVKDVAFPTENGIKFYEFANSDHSLTPSNISGYSIDSTSIKLTWTGAGNKFRIFRGDNEKDLILIDSVITNEYIDKNISSNRNYYYSIQSVDFSKKYPNSNLSKIENVYSHFPSRVISVISNTQNSLQVKFDQKINNTIENLLAFEVNNGIFPNSISAETQYSYLLNFRKNLPIGNNKLIVHNLNDYYGSPVPLDTISFSVDSVATKREFYITSYEIINPYKIKLTFNLNVNSTEAENVKNYKFSPENHASKVTLDEQNKNIVYISLKGYNLVGSIGKEYTLQVNNVSSSVESGSIPINSGAGSYVVLTSFANNLSNVFVYPNPAKINGGVGNLTFANLPKRAKITIFSLNGKKINEIQETNGDGGVQFNLRDMQGNQLDSGIYIFRVVKLDDSNNEVEEKIGKFAVLK